MMRYLLILLMLTGCATQTPTEAIVDAAIKNVDETIDYAENNIAQTPDTAFLMNGLKSCRTNLVSCEQSYKAELATCEANNNYWRLATFGLFLLIVGAIISKIRSKL